MLHQTMRVVNKERSDNMTKPNQDIRNYARSHGVPLWSVAQGLGIAESTIMKWLRLPLTEERKQQMIEIIDERRAF